VTAAQQTPTVSDTPAARRAVALANGWTRWYTGWVGEEAGARRRAEIESDLWEQLADDRASRVVGTGVGASISWRVIAGMPADLAWMRYQRAIARGGSNRDKESRMNAVARVIGRWWWVVVAYGVAAAYVVIAVGNLSEPGMPYLEGAVFVIALVAVIVIGTLVRVKWPVAGGLLIVAAAGPALLAVWAPVIAVLGGLVVIGAVLDLVILPAAQRQITGVAAGSRFLAILGVFVAVATPLGMGAFPGLLVTVVIVVVLIVVALVRRHQKSTVAVANVPA
jgi:hypothetical protein